MSILLGCDSVSLDFATKHVFTCVTLGINEGDRIGIVGRNGDGKSSLLSVLSKQIQPDNGCVTYRRNIRVGLLGQSDKLDPERSVGWNVVGDCPEYEWAGNAKIRSIIAGLIGDLDWNMLVGELSGGQRRRVDLARLLIGDWDVLMLDEPTNHLDVQAITWLACHLKNRWRNGEGALLCVTHDRWFLDEIANNMWEVHDGVVEPFEGGYSAYILQRVERMQAAEIAEQKRQNMMRKELAWLSRGARARSSKPKFHVEAARALIAEDPPVRNTLELKRLACSRLGKQVIDLKDVTVSFDNKKIIDDVNWIIGPGDRIGILGENGAGKTTLLNVLCGRIQPVSGRVKIGKSVKFGVLSQQLNELATIEKDQLREVISRYKRSYIVDGKETTPEKLLERLGFEPHQLLSRVCDLSGGQRRRLMLLLTILEEPNVLILDEPGNDLDTDMLTIVEDLLDSWPGTLILVSHDRYLMERVTDDQYALINGHIRHCPAGVDEFLSLVNHNVQEARSTISNALCASTCTSDEPDNAEKKAEEIKSTISSAQIRLLKKKLGSLERKAQTQKIRLKELNEELLNHNPTDYIGLEEIQQKVEETQEKIDSLETEWLEISEELDN